MAESSVGEGRSVPTGCKVKVFIAHTTLPALIVPALTAAARVVNDVQGAHGHNAAVSRGPKGGKAQASPCPQPDGQRARPWASLHLLRSDRHI